jgi:uncharacterized membrane protein YfcA
MNAIVIETILGLLCGIFLGITGIAPMGIILIVLDILKIGDYKSNIGAILFLNLFPITIGAVFEFYKSNKIDFQIVTILLLTIILGSFIGSRFVVGSKNVLSTKMIKIITAYLSLFMSMVFFYSAYYEKN